jgi:hypothetical protein
LPGLGLFYAKRLFGENKRSSFALQMLGNRLGAATNMKLLVDFAEVCSNSKKTDIQLGTNFFVGQSTGDARKHLHFSSGKIVLIF